jgi:hypothetical protein
MCAVYQRQPSREFCPPAPPRVWVLGGPRPADGHMLQDGPSQRRHRPISFPAPRFRLEDVAPTAKPPIPPGVASRRRGPEHRGPGVSTSAAPPAGSWRGARAARRAHQHHTAEAIRLSSLISLMICLRLAPYPQTHPRSGWTTKTEAPVTATSAVAGYPGARHRRLLVGARSARRAGGAASGPAGQFDRGRAPRRAADDLETLRADAHVVPNAESRRYLPPRYRCVAGTSAITTISLGSRWRRGSAAGRAATISRAPRAPPAGGSRPW